MVNEALETIRQLGDRGERGVVVTPLDGATMSVLAADGEVLAGPELATSVATAAREVLDAGTARLVEIDGGSWFVEPVTPPPRLLVFGAIAVADALVPMAAAAGFSVEVVDPRPWLAIAERHPAAVAVHCGVPAEVLESLEVDSGTAIVSFLHETRLEGPVLHAVLTGPAGYVGAMGSRRTTAAKREHLREAGLAEEQIQRLHAPIGLDVGAVTPEEIAVAVLAEIVASRRGLA